MAIMAADEIYIEWYLVSNGKLFIRPREAWCLFPELWINEGNMQK